MKNRQLELPDSRLPLALFQCAKATGANGNNLGRAVDCKFDFTDIGLPGSARFSVGMRYVVAVHDTLSADTANCHMNTSCVYTWNILIHNNGIIAQFPKKNNT